MRICNFAMLMLAAFATHASAVGTAYQCNDAAGNVSFQDQPCVSAQKQTELDVNMSSSSLPPAPPAQTSTTVHPTVAKAAAVRQTQPQSYECHSDNGMVFYRHHNCPATVAQRQRSQVGGHWYPGKQLIHVASVPVPRSTACQAIYATDADTRFGSEHDQRYSTYERGLGHDPCQ